MKDDTMNRSFNVHSLYDVEIIPSLQQKLGCSTATIYRTIKSSRLPILHLPHKRSQILIPDFSLWKICASPIWKKYLKRIKYKLPGKRRLAKLSAIYADSDLITLFNESWFEPLTLAETVAGAETGLIPADDKLNLPVWFIAALKGLASLGLPTKSPN